MEEKTKTFKKIDVTSDHSGITLIALVITIIVMLILVAVTILLVLNGGLFNTAVVAKQETRGASVQEIKDFWLAEKQANEFAGNEQSITLEELVDDLKNQKLITEDEKEQILTTGSVTIGKRTIFFLHKSM